MHVNLSNYYFTLLHCAMFVVIDTPCQSSQLICSLWSAINFVHVILLPNTTKSSTIFCNKTISWPACWLSHVGRWPTAWSCLRHQAQQKQFQKISNRPAFLYSTTALGLWHLSPLLWFRCEKHWKILVFWYFLKFLNINYLNTSVQLLRSFFISKETASAKRR